MNNLLVIIYRYLEHYKINRKTFTNSKRNKKKIIANLFKIYIKCIKTEKKITMKTNESNKTLSILPT